MSCSFYISLKEIYKHNTVHYMTVNRLRDSRLTLSSLRYDVSREAGRASSVARSLRREFICDDFDELIFIR